MALAAALSRNLGKLSGIDQLQIGNDEDLRGSNQIAPRRERADSILLRFISSTDGVRF